uniref:Transposase n=1 Tax=Heterorhabditis bacteriophora TaxID=37862 RepID=A0A1I7WAU4_HETBA
MTDLINGTLRECFVQPEDAYRYIF